jgi:hypothetical protein
MHIDIIFKIESSLKTGQRHQTVIPPDLPLKKGGITDRGIKEIAV